MPFYPKSEDLELRFIIDGNLINTIHCAGYSHPQIYASIERFIQNAKGNCCRAILYNTKKKEEVRRVTRTRKDKE